MHGHDTFEAALPTPTSPKEDSGSEMAGQSPGPEREDSPASPLATHQLLQSHQLDEDPYLSTLGIYINTALYALICITCQEGVLPQHLLAHLGPNGKHADAHLTVQQSEINRVVMEWYIPDGFPKMSSDSNLPFDGLRQHNGFSCQGQNCNYASATESTMKKHKCLASGKKSTYKTATVQHFHNGEGQGKIYWACCSPPPQAAHLFSEGALAFLESVHHTVETKLQQSTAKPDPRTVSPWLLVTKWPDLVRNHEPEHLCALVAPPAKDTWETLMPGLVEDYINSSLDIPMHELELMRLNSPDPTKEYVTCS
jgi:hypothetical protein